MGKLLSWNVEGNGGAFVWNACDPDARIRSVKQLQPFVQVFHADVGVAVLLGGGNELNVRDHLKTDSIVYNTDFQLAVVSLYDLDDQMAFSLLGLQAVDNGVFRKGLDGKAGNFTGKYLFRNLDVTGNFVLEAHLLKIHVKPYIFHFYGNAGEIVVPGKGVHFQQASQGNHHLVNFLIVDHLGLPGNGVQHIEKEMGVHLGLQCPNPAFLISSFCW